MKFSTVLTSTLFASATLAAPLTAHRRARAMNRKSHPPIKPGTQNERLLLSNTTQVQYSSNWAGAVLIGTGYSAVTGEFTVPTPSGGDGGEQACASAWVGIDGDTCSTAILQTGVDFCVQDGSVSFGAWYEWFPDYAYDFDLDISAGDKIKVTVDASSDSAGKATVQNLSTGKSVSHSFNGGVQGDLCEYNAEWIVEDFESNGSPVPFADFGTVSFTGAQATKGGSTVSASGATVMDIKQNGQVLTSVSVSGSTVNVKYV